VRLQKVKKKKWRFISIILGAKLNVWNKLINAAAAAAAAAHATRSRQRTPARASRQGAPRLTNS